MPHVCLICSHPSLQLLCVLLQPHRIHPCLLLHFLQISRHRVHRWYHNHRLFPLLLPHNPALHHLTHPAPSLRCPPVLCLLYLQLPQRNHKLLRHQLVLPLCLLSSLPLCLQGHQPYTHQQSQVLTHLSYPVRPHQHPLAKVLQHLLLQIHHHLRRGCLLQPHQQYPAIFRQHSRREDHQCSLAFFHLSYPAHYHHPSQAPILQHVLLPTRHTCPPHPHQ
mmetsp:Transcript_23404/g.23601  ORF Transcript_23404/g.23601 Transcript_23404/m.23601 type:complete len:220 (-) Transcript_23404:2468-3127(-)